METDRVQRTFNAQPPPLLGILILLLTHLWLSLKSVDYVSVLQFSASLQIGSRWGRTKPSPPLPPRLIASLSEVFSLTLIALVDLLRLTGFFFASSPKPVRKLVFSKQFYWCNVWSNTSEYNLNRIQAVQNFAAHILGNARKYDHVSPILKDLEWLPVRLHLHYCLADDLVYAGRLIF